MRSRRDISPGHERHSVVDDRVFLMKETEPSLVPRGVVDDVQGLVVFRPFPRQLDATNLGTIIERVFVCCVGVSCACHVLTFR